VVAPGDVSFVLTWLGSAAILWLCARFVPGVEVRGVVRALVAGFVFALVFVALSAVVDPLALG
jgi:uncharacterized membrane protein YvlD (DUF360 family)